MSNSQAGGNTNRKNYIRSQGVKVSKSASFHHTFLSHGIKPRHLTVKRTSYHEEESGIVHSRRKQRNKRSEYRASTFHSSTYDEGFMESYNTGSELNDQSLRSGALDRKALKKLSLTKREVKRQEGILEFIQGEFFNLALLRVMQQVYIKGLVKDLQMDQTTLNKLFPNLEDHVMFATHLTDQLKKRQNLSKIIGGIGDILVDHFDEVNGENMKRLYGDLCSKENEILVFYREMIKNDKKFASFFKKCDKSAQTKRQDFCSCLQSIIQRIYKTPTFIQSLIDSSDLEDHTEDYKHLEKALEMSKEIMKDVHENVQVYKRGNLLLETHAKIEPRSYTMFRGSRKFDRKELLKRNRKLLYSSNVQLNIPDQKRTVDVFLLVLSDCIIFLETNNGKYVFLPGQEAVVPFYKMIIREAAADERGLYLVSMTSQRMYPLRLPSEEECRALAKVIKIAIDKCSEDDEGITSEEEEERRMRKRQMEKARQAMTQVELYDRRINKLYDEKMDRFRMMNDAVGRRRMVASLDATDADSDQELPQKADDPPLSKSNFLSIKKELNRPRETFEEQMHFYVPQEPTLSPSRSPVRRLVSQPPLLQATEQVNKLTMALHGVGKSSLSSFKAKKQKTASRPVSTLVRRSDTFGGFDNARPFPSPRTRHSNSTHVETQSELTQDKSESRSLDSIPDDSDQPLTPETPSHSAKKTVNRSSAPEKYLIPLERELESPVPLLTLEQVTTLIDLAQAFSAYQSFASQQDTHIERLKVEILQETINYKKQLFGIQEAELKRNHVKKQELSDDLQHERKLFKKEKEEWLIDAGKKQQELFDKKNELKRDKELADQERKSIMREKEELQLVRAELDRLQTLSPDSYGNADIDALLEKLL